MKYYIIRLITVVILAGTLLSSCEKFLDQAPTGEESREYIFQDYLRAQRYLDLLYYYTPPLWTAGFFSSTSTTRYGFLETATDMSEYTASYGAANNTFNVGNWLGTAASAEISRWDDIYPQIRRCNMFLENMNLFNNEPLYDGVSRKETMKGEVHFFIAFYYFELLKRYGGVPLIKQVLELDSDIRIPRSSYDETRDYIIENLTLALPLLPDEWDPSQYGRVTKAAVLALRSRLLLYSASPLNNPSDDQARWLEAANAARDLIDYCEATGLHPLYHDYQNLFMRDYPENMPEIIMPRHRGSNTFTFTSNLIRYHQATPGEGFQGYASCSPTQNFVDRFEIIQFDAGGNPTGTVKFDWSNPEHVDNMYHNRDPRFYYTVIFNDQFWISRKIETWRDGTNYGKDINPKDHLFTRTGYYMRKYWPRELQSLLQPGSASISAFYFRYGEVLLNYAEAMNEVFGPDADGLGRTTGEMTARDAVNMIRARLKCPSDSDISGASDPYYRVLLERQWNPDFPVLPDGMPPVPAGLSKTEFRERCRNERVIELSFETHYWFDILRWKKGPENIGGTIYGVDVVKSGSDFIYTRKVVEQRYFDPQRMYLYPIPQREIYIMGIEQNPGW